MLSHQRLTTVSASWPGVAGVTVLGHLACVLGDDLRLFFFGGWRSRLFAAAEHQAENGQ